MVGDSAIEEYPTDSGPGDYALCTDGRILGVVEAKKITVGPQNVLTQAQRYFRGVASSPMNFDGNRVTHPHEETDMKFQRAP